MDERTFWQLIDRIDGDVLMEDQDAAIEPLVAALSRLKPENIASFEEHMAQRLYALDGRRFAEQAGESSDSADGFLYARCFVVARGEMHYRRVLADPTLVPKSVDHWCEALLNAASTALELSTGNAGDFETTVSYETGSNSAQWE
jgi:hypothetical protein